LAASAKHKQAVDAGLLPMYPEPKFTTDADGSKVEAYPGDDGVYHIYTTKKNPDGTFTRTTEYGYTPDDPNRWLIDQQRFTRRSDGTAKFLTPDEPAPPPDPPTPTQQQLKAALGGLITTDPGLLNDPRLLGAPGGNVPQGGAPRGGTSVNVPPAPPGLPVQPLPPTTVARSAPASSRSSSAGSGSCQAGARYQCVYSGAAAAPQGGDGTASYVANYVMSACFPAQGAATCTVDTVFPGSASVASSTTCDQPKDQASFAQQCKTLGGRLVSPATTYADVAPVAPLPVAPLRPPALASLPPALLPPPVVTHGPALLPPPVLPDPPTHAPSGSTTTQQGSTVTPHVNIYNPAPHRPPPSTTWQRHAAVTPHVNIHNPPSHNGSSRTTTSPQKFKRHVNVHNGAPYQRSMGEPSASKRASAASCRCERHIPASAARSAGRKGGIDGGPLPISISWSGNHEI
jgi:hypothetical protein